MDDLTVTEKSEAQKIAQGLLDAAKQQSEEILDFLKGKGFNDATVSFHTFAQDDKPLGRRIMVSLTIDAVIPNPLN
jgi:hypothetical protein